MVCAYADMVGADWLKTEHHHSHFESILSTLGDFQILLEKYCLFNMFLWSPSVDYVWILPSCFGHC